MNSENKSKTMKTNSMENELCVFCYINKPNIMLDPCGHGGVCKLCIVNYLKYDDGKCPFCKAAI